MSSHAASPAPVFPSQQRAEARAADFLARHQEGEAPDLEAWALRLDDEPERASFRQLVGDALRAAEQLPAQHGTGAVLAGRWRLLRELGSGRTGRVFAALDQETGGEVAVKLLAAFLGDGIPPGSRFARECRALAAFGHPSIAAVQEIGHDGGLPFVVTELVAGPSLAALLQRVRRESAPANGAPLRAPTTGRPLLEALSPPDSRARTTILDRRSWWRSVAAITADIASTAAAAHACGLVHGGLKPENLVLRADGTAVLLDYGLVGALDPAATQLARSFFGSVACGSPKPELEGAPRRAQGDVYQLGLVLYELLTLRHAFPGGCSDATREKVALGDFPRPRELDERVPAELEAICLHALHVSPEHRYATMADLHADLQRFLQGAELPVAARSEACAQRTLRLRYALRRHRAALWLGAVIAAAAAVAAVLPGA